MARMIPGYISKETKSTGEREIFNLFKDDPFTDEWIVLHSLALAKHSKRMMGEIDFLVIAPRLGVFCLEVKSGRVCRRDGIWYFTNRFGKTDKKTRGPFEQAKEAMFSLKNTIEKRFGKSHPFSKVLFGYGVIFPHIEFNLDSVEYESWQIYDKNSIKFPVSKFIKSLSSNTSKKWESIYGIKMADSSLPNKKTVNELASFLRKDFEKIIAPADELRMIEDKILILTDEQYRCLDQLEDNPRVLIKGAAGTGKTMLALEAGKRALLNGERVALFCYNKLLGEWLKRSFTKNLEVEGHYYVGTFHAFMVDLVRESGLEKEIPKVRVDEKFFRRELPIYAIEALEKIETSFDRIIIDEVQDLICEEYLEIIDIILKKGINRGTWNMFGDFEKQAIYGDLNAKNMTDLLELNAGFATYKLNINCRNTKQICRELAIVSNVKIKDYLPSNLEGPPVDYYFWNSRKEEAIELEKCLNRIKNNGIKGRFISILSPYSMENSVIDMLPKNIRNIILEYSFKNIPLKRDAATFSTIQSFKGMENSYIILVDIESLENLQLLYVGMSRAHVKLIIFFHRNMQEALINQKLGSVKSEKY